MGAMDIPGMQILEKYPFEITRVIEEPSYDFFESKNWSILRAPGVSWVAWTKAKDDKYNSLQNSKGEESHETVPPSRKKLLETTTRQNQPEDLSLTRKRKRKSCAEKAPKREIRQGKENQTETPVRSIREKKKRKMEEPVAQDAPKREISRSETSLLIMRTPTKQSRRRTLFSPETFEASLDFTLLFGENLESPVRRHC
ncbi:uncharacterized protein LOC123307442 [Coccinella septempunctata]|uniref:uncharacterized protein LOC123307442 n=1 Tax=Coccinella septempunctata TaxID=41139 RepID=UPI001D086A76|nr:uncharacterized protein LOC123307442 [Coccinella septempunctata]